MEQDTKEILYKPSYKAITLLKIRGVIITAAVGFLTGAIAVFSPLAAVIFGFIYITLFSLTVTLYAPLMYRESRIITDSKKITAEKGVIFHRRCSMDYSAIEYTVLFSTPLQKRLNIYSLIIYSKGGKIIINNITGDMPLYLLKNKNLI